MKQYEVFVCQYVQGIITWIDQWCNFCNHFCNIPYGIKIQKSCFAARGEVRIELMKVSLWMCVLLVSTSFKTCMLKVQLQKVYICFEHFVREGMPSEIVSKHSKTLDLITEINMWHVQHS